MLQAVKKCPQNAHNKHSAMTHEDHEAEPRARHKNTMYRDVSKTRRVSRYPTAAPIRGLKPWALETQASGQASVTYACCRRVQCRYAINA